MQMYMQRFTVEGSGRFPFDMLRYDSAHPAYESETHQLSMDIRDGKDYTKPRRIQLVRYSRVKNDGPTEARWRSFGWKVVTWETVL